MNSLRSELCWAVYRYSDTPIECFLANHNAWNYLARSDCCVIIYLGPFIGELYTKCGCHGKVKDRLVKGGYSSLIQDNF